MGTSDWEVVFCPGYTVSRARAGTEDDDEKPVILTLNRLITKVRNRKELPNRADFVELAIELAKDALLQKRSFQKKNGDVVEYDSPAHTAANKAAELAATLSLQAKPELEKPTAEEESKLAALGYKLVKVDEMAPVGERVQ